MIRRKGRMSALTTPTQHHIGIKQEKEIKSTCTRTSLVVQWPRLHAANAGSLGSVSIQGTRSCMSQLRDRMPQLGSQTSHTATETWHGQINRNEYFFK